MLGDTLIAGTTSNCGNKYSELFVFLMKRKSEAHEDLSNVSERCFTP